MGISDDAEQTFLGRHVECPTEGISDCRQCAIGAAYDHFAGLEGDKCATISGERDIGRLLRASYERGIDGDLARECRREISKRRLGKSATEYEGREWAEPATNFQDVLDHRYPPWRQLTTQRAASILNDDPYLPPACTRVRANYSRFFACFRDRGQAGAGESIVEIIDLPDKQRPVAGSVVQGYDLFEI